MNEAMNSHGHRPHSFTARDVVAIGFRHQRVLVLCFVGVVLGVSLSALFLPTKYRAETKLLVKRERVDPVISRTKRAHDISRHGERRRDQLGSGVDSKSRRAAKSGDDLRSGQEEVHLQPAASWTDSQNRLDKAVLDLRSDLHWKSSRRPM